MKGLPAGTNPWEVTPAGPVVLNFMPASPGQSDAVPVMTAGVAGLVRSIMVRAAHVPKHLIAVTDRLPDTISTVEESPVLVVPLSDCRHS